MNFKWRKTRVMTFRMEDCDMDYQVIEKGGQKYIMLGSGGELVSAEQDALELVAACAEHGTNLLLICGERLSDDFLRLATGLAGAILQKFTMYGVRAASVVEDDKIKGKFKNLLAECNRGGMFRVYDNFEAAETWLLEC